MEIGILSKIQVMTDFFGGRDTYLQNDILGIDKSILVCYNRLMGATITVGG